MNLNNVAIFLLLLAISVFMCRPDLSLSLFDHFTLIYFWSLSFLPAAVWKLCEPWDETIMNKLTQKVFCSHYCSKWNRSTRKMSLLFDLVLPFFTCSRYKWQSNSLIWNIFLWNHWIFYFVMLNKFLLFLQNFALRNITSQGCNRLFCSSLWN